MQKLNFSTSINADAGKVWNVLWNDANYPKWTSVFCEGSHAITDWKEGSKVLFLDGKGSGMVSTVAVNKPKEHMSFKHLGEVKNGIEDTESDKVKGWAGATENYNLKETDGVTELKVDVDIVEEFKDYFMKTFPKALEQIKVLSEAS